MNTPPKVVAFFFETCVAPCSTSSSVALERRESQPPSLSLRRRSASKCLARRATSSRTLRAASESPPTREFMRPIAKLACTSASCRGKRAQRCPSARVCTAMATRASCGCRACAIAPCQRGATASTPSRSSPSPSRSRCAGELPRGRRAGRVLLRGSSAQQQRQRPRSRTA